MKKQEYIYKARVIYIVDGDTVDVSVDLGFNITHKVRLRLADIDAYELRDKDEEKRAVGVAGRRRLVELLQDKDVVIESRKTDKYGRYLANIYLGSVNINQQLISEGLAVPYPVQ
jgi:micrococcal nuclease